MSDDGPKQRRRGHNEGTVYQTANGSFRGAVTLGWTPDGKLRRKYVSGKTKTETQRKVDLLKRQRDDGDAIPARDQTVGQFLTTWLEEVVKVHNRPKTYQSYEQICRVHLIPSLGRHKLVKLTAAQISAYMASKDAAGQSPRSVNYHRAILRAAINHAKRWDLVTRNVAELVQPRPEKRYEATALTLAQAGQFMAAARDDRLEALFTVALALGLRRGEALGLQWRDVDFAAGTIQVRQQMQFIDGRASLVEPKTDRSRRTIAVPASVLTSLRAHHHRQQFERVAASQRWKGTEWDLVFCTTVGTPCDESNVNRIFKAVLKRAGLPEMRYHDLRHSCGSLLAARGVAPRVAMEILGHSDIRMTMNVYTHVELGPKVDAAERISDLFERPE